MNRWANREEQPLTKSSRRPAQTRYDSVTNRNGTLSVLSASHPKRTSVSGSPHLDYYEPPPVDCSARTALSVARTVGAYVRHVAAGRFHKWRAQRRGAARAVQIFRSRRPDVLARAAEPTGLPRFVGAGGC